jgi:hypothetical protein
MTEPFTVAALYVAKGGAYWDLRGVDPWDEERDARLYAGPWPVVAHPPCARWCQLAGLVEARWGHRRGDDGGCFASALASVQKWGGVLEHPAYSSAWTKYNLPKPSRGHWRRGHPLLGASNGWATEVSQVAYAHRARKRTWLYYVGSMAPPDLDWSEPEASAWVSNCANHGRKFVELMGSNECKATPLAFRDLLLSIARFSAVAEPRAAMRAST